MSNLRKKLQKIANKIVCVDAQTNGHDYEYFFTGISNDELQNNYEAHKEEIKRALTEYTINALPENKNDLLDYWLFNDAEILSSEELEKIEDNSEYDDSHKVFNDFKDELVKNITESIGYLCDEGSEDFIGE